MKFKISKIILILLLTIGVIMFFVPVFWTVTTSFKTPEEIWLIPPTIFPYSFTHLDNYEEVFQREEFGRYLLNTFVLCVAAVGISLVVASMAGYGFSKFKFPLKEVFFFMVIGVLMVPFHTVRLSGRT